MSSDLHHKNSEHIDIYSSLKIHDDVKDGHRSNENEATENEQGMYYKFQKNMSLNK